MVDSQTVTAERGRSGLGWPAAAEEACSWLSLHVGSEGRCRTLRLLFLQGPFGLLERCAFSHGSGTCGASSQALGFLQAAHPPSPLTPGLRLGLVLRRPLPHHHLAAPRPREPFLSVSVCLSVSPCPCQTSWRQLGPLGAS